MTSGTDIMDREEGMTVLRGRGWLSSTPADFKLAILARSEWRCFEAGAPIQLGGEDDGELLGLASGVVALRTILGRADTPLMHLVHPVFWFGYVPVLAGRPRRLIADARMPVWLAKVPQTAVRALLAERPERWRHMTELSIINDDIAQTVTADLLIRDSERRCAAVLLRLGARRFSGPDDREPVEVPLTQTDLAGAANLSRNTAATMAQRLAARGLIVLGYRSITILVPAALRAFVNSG